MQAMTSKERVLATVRRQGVDRLPICFEGVCHGVTRFVHDRLPDPLDRVRFYLDRGVDVALGGSPDTNVWPGSCQTRSWRESPPDEPHVLLCKEYVTPLGSLRQVVRWTPDYDEQPAGRAPHPGEVRLFSDHNVPPGRSKEYLVSRPEQLGALRLLLQPLRGEDRRAYVEDMRRRKAFCDQRGILLSGYLAGVADPMIWMSGVEAVLIAAMDRPDFLAEYAQIVTAWDRANLELMIEAGCDFIVRRGWYESADFWSPRLFETFLLPPLKAEIDLARQAGVAYAYCMNSGVNPLLGLLSRARPDILCNLDPQAPGTDLDLVKKTLGGDMTLSGGMNNVQVLERGSRADVEAGVRWAFEHLTAGGGFILAPGDSILDTGATAQSNFDLMIETWKSLASALA
jgi:hypothetical protein